jgi:hypothetical protein
MLFRPTAEDRLQAILSQLAGWGVEADKFRLAAAAAQRNEQQSSGVVSAAEDLHDGLMSALDELDVSLDGVSPGTVEFTTVLNLQTKVLALLESVGSSLDILTSHVPHDQRPDAIVTTDRKRLLAAE